MEMYFIALVAPSSIDEKVRAWKEYMRDRYGCVVALRSPAHVTLVPPFWMDPSLQATIETYLSDYSQSREPFSLRLKDFAAFPPRVIFVDVIENSILPEVQAEINKGLNELRLFKADGEERPFKPHISIATRDLTKKIFREAWDHFKGKQFEADWQVEGISILKHNKKNWDVVYTSRFQKKSL